VTSVSDGPKAKPGKKVVSKETARGRKKAVEKPFLHRQGDWKDHGKETSSDSSLSSCKRKNKAPAQDEGRRTCYMEKPKRVTHNTTADKKNKGNNMRRQGGQNLLKLGDSTKKNTGREREKEPGQWD